MKSHYTTVIVVQEAQEPLQGGLVCRRGERGELGCVLGDGRETELRDVVADGGAEELGLCWVVDESYCFLVLLDSPREQN